MGLTDSALWRVGMSQFANRCKSSHDSRQNAHNVFMSVTNHVHMHILLLMIAQPKKSENTSIDVCLHVFDKIITVTMAQAMLTMSARQFAAITETLYSCHVRLAQAVTLL